MAQILVLKGPNIGVTYQLGERTRIGRLGENEIQVADPNVSRMHAEVVQEGSSFFIYDRGSKNGVLVNGKEVSERKLEAGDEIVVGGATFVFNGNLRIENARYSDNSIYFPDADQPGVMLDVQAGGGKKSAPAATLPTAFTRIFDGDLPAAPALIEIISRFTLEHFKARNVFFFWRDSPVSPLRCNVAVPYGHTAFFNSKLLTRLEQADQPLAFVSTVPVSSQAELQINEGPTHANSEIAADETGRRSLRLGSDKADKSGKSRPSSETETNGGMAAPLLADGRVQGSIVVIADGKTAPSAEDLASLAAIAGLAQFCVKAIHAAAQCNSLSTGHVVPVDGEQRSASIRSLRMQEIYNSAKRSAESEGVVLITGERGCGKETLARFIHASSSRSQGNFVEVNCASIPADQFEKEFFGVQKDDGEGSQTTLGLVEQAQGGTLYLANIDELNLDLQPRFLRFLQDQAYIREGGSVPIGVDARIISSTSADLAAQVRAGKFREDLWYRLNVVPFHMPPLRERREDIASLVEFFIGIFSPAMNRNILAANDSAISSLQKYDWPGNIHELSNAVERAVMLADSRVLSSSDFSHIEEARRRLNSQADIERKRDTKPLAEVERQHIIIALKKHNFNQARAAEALGLHRNTLRNKIIEYGIEIQK